MFCTASLSERRSCAPFSKTLLGFLSGLAAFAALADTSVNLAWNPSTSPNVTSYTIHYGAASRAYTNSVAVGNTTNATVSGLAEGVTYYFAATCVDDAGLESDYSNEASNAPPVLAEQPPTISAISDQITLQDTATPAIPFVIGDPAVPAANLTLSGSSSSGALVPAANIVFGGSGSNRTVTITPASGQSGAATITLTVSDGTNSASSIFSLTVVAQRPPPATPPTISAIGNLTIAENSSTPALPLTLGDAQVDPRSLTLWAASTNLNLLPTNNIICRGTNCSRSVTLTPLKGQIGESDITLFVSDGNATASTTFHLTVLSGWSTPVLTLLVSGNGKISPNLTAQKLTIGKTYAVTAQPSPGQIFCGWSGSITSLSAKVSLVLKSNLVLQANFAPLALTRSGSGTFSPDPRTAQGLTAGKSYTTTAIPASGQVFAGWSGMSTSAAPCITFVVSTNLHLQANFIPSPFLPIQGTYNGLFHEDAAVRAESAGSFSLTLSYRGSYSGTLQLGGRRTAFNGQLNLQCQGSQSIAVTPSNTLTLTLSFGTGDQVDKVAGTLTDGTWVSALLGDRAVFNSRTRPAPYAGAYTLVLPGSNGDPSQPGGDGFGTLRVTTSGSVSLSASLPDGTGVSQSATVSKDGYWPLYVPVYSGQGVLMSWLSFTNQPDSDLNGLLTLIKPALSNAQYYAAGFTQQCQALGSLYVPPPGKYPLCLCLTNAQLAFSGGNLSAEFTNAIAAGRFGTVTNQSGNALAVTFYPLVGTFKGSVHDPVTRSNFAFRGAVLQKQNAGFGLLLGTNQTSQVNLTP